MVSAWWAISQQAGRVVSSEAPSGPLPTLLPLLPQSTRRAHEIVARPLLISHLSFCFSCSHIHWRHWRKRIRAPASSGWVCGRTSLPAHSYRMEGEGEPSVQSVQSHIRTRWTRLFGGWTSGFSATLYGCAPGLPGQDARQWGSRSGCSFTQVPETDLVLHATKATAPARHDTTLSWSAKDPGPRTPWIQRLRSPRTVPPWDLPTVPRLNHCNPRASEHSR